MIARCAVDPDLGMIRSVLAAVDCQTRTFAQGGYIALTGPQSPLPVALTLALTIYVALIGWRLLFARGGPTLVDAPLLVLKIGVVLALVGSWSLFQTLVFDVADVAPLQLAAIAAGPLQHDGGALAAEPLGGLQIAQDQLTLAARAFGKLAGPAARSYTSGEAGAAEALSASATALFMSTAGLLAVALMAVGVLTAIGPVFVILFLFPHTRGLFVGWLRALLGAALVPFGVWVLAVMLLSVLEPWLVELARQRETLDLKPETAMTAAAVVFVFSLGQLVLAGGFLLVAAGLRLPRTAAARGDHADATAPAPEREEPALSRPQQLALTLARPAVAAGTASPAAALATVSFSSGTAEGGASPHRTEAPAWAPGLRIGDTYRRPDFRDRRMGAAT